LNHPSPKPAKTFATKSAKSCNHPVTRELAAQQVIGRIADEESPTEAEGDDCCPATLQRRQLRTTTG
jgi:hypothetical protein